MSYLEYFPAVRVIGTRDRTNLWWIYFDAYSTFYSNMGEVLRMCFDRRSWILGIAKFWARGINKRIMSSSSTSSYSSSLYRLSTFLQLSPYSTWGILTLDVTGDQCLYLFIVIAFLLSLFFTAIVILLSSSFYCRCPFTAIVINVVVATVVVFAAVVSLLLVKSWLWICTCRG